MPGVRVINPFVDLPWPGDIKASFATKLIRAPARNPGLSLYDEQAAAPIVTLGKAVTNRRIDGARRCSK
jgi:fructose-specific component phosphotransferase system IIB-like protein